MPATARHRTPKGYEIVFDEASHIYTTVFNGRITPTGAVPDWNLTPDGNRAGSRPDGDDRAKFYYVSGTTFIHKFVPPFDPKGEIAAKKAMERGVSPDQIRFEWKQKGKIATEMGTRVHETCEDILHGRTDFRNTPRDDHERRLMSAGWRACQFILKNYDILGIEQMVGDLDCQIAGTIDLLARRKSDGRYTIFDWKTNAKIDFRNTFREGRFCLGPISHIENCSGNLYAMQLSLYEMVMKKAGYVPRTTLFDRVIIHLADDGPHPYPLPDMAVEVRDMTILMLEQPPF